MTTDPDLLFEKVVTKFNAIRVYRNRVVYSEGTFFAKETTILIRSITAVTLDGPAKFLKITTQDGQVHKPKFAAGSIAQEAQKAILSVL
jgi:hypothetical protein